MDLKVGQVKEDKNDKKEKKTDSQLMEIIKKMNGFSDKQFKETQKIQTIELVLEDFVSMHLFYKFKNLLSLTLINCSISTIQGLHQSTKLKEIWLNQNNLTKIQGLEQCKSLKSLFLCHNQIKKIEGLNNLLNLQTLWLCDNKIEILQNLECNYSLRQLWVASNQIQYIKTSLDHLVNLTDFNISGNKVSSFKQALNLNRLPNLKILSFYDPHFGQNPICTLCNYQTYVLYHLRNVVKLDTLAIPDQSKAFAEGTFMRKKMFYNMRIKTIQRSFSTLGKLIKKAREIKMDSLSEDIENLSLKIDQYYGETDNKQSLQLKQFYKLKIQQIHHLKSIYLSMKKTLENIGNAYIRKQMTELDTGGNIRLEEGKPTDRWYTSCVDLLKSRFQEKDLAFLYIKDFQIKRIVRIHNKFLKTKFQEKMESMVDVSNNSYKKSLQYLFYGIDPNNPNEIENVFEEGFRSYNQAKSVGLCPYTPLYNSLLGADLPRLLDYKQDKKNKEKFKEGMVSKRTYGNLMLFPPGSLLICKVLLLKSSNDVKYPYFNPEIAPSQEFKKQPLEPHSFFQDNAIFRVNYMQPRHKIWFFYDNNLVLPEYLVEFDYILQNSNQNKVADFGEHVCVLENTEEEFISSRNIHQYKDDINKIYNKLVKQVNNYQFENIEGINNLNLQLTAQELDKADIGVVKVAIINYLKYCLSKSTLNMLNQNLVDECLQEFNYKKLNDVDVKNLNYINFSNLKINELSFLNNFQSLRFVILSYNKIVQVNPLVNCINLQKLDLSHNQIINIEGIKYCQKLSYLDLNHNDISQLNALMVLQQNKKLVQLKIAFNPFLQEKGIYRKIIKILTQIMILNNRNIIIEDRMDQKQHMNHQINEMFVRQHGKIIQSKKLTFEGKWNQTIEGLTLMHCKLKSIVGIQRFVNLRQLNLSHNYIDRIEKISTCRLLYQLNLQKNRISKIQNLQQLIHLKKLELGKNSISKIEGIDYLQNLMQLSIEDNEIATLYNFPNLKNLMQLYMANNKLIDSKEIKNLADLTKLIILDLSGNPLSRDSNYRIYTLFVIKKLKVFDGISIENSETQLANDLFTGRLTEEILNSKLEGKKAEDIRQLDLSNCKLRDFDDVFSNLNFPNLSQLNLEQNLFTSTKMLGYLPNLKLLLLNKNKIETLLYSNDMTIKKGLNGCSNNLQILDLCQNNLKDLNGLQFCMLKELKIFRVAKNQISRIDCLQNLKSLKDLDLNKNKIKNFEVNSFIACNPLKVLRVDENGLRSFNNIQKLFRLHYLYANSNRISDIPDIEKLTELPCLAQLQLNGNSISRRPGYRQTLIKKLPNLSILDGRQITSQQRERTDPISSNDKSNLANFNIPQVNQKLVSMNDQIPVKICPVQGFLMQNLYGQKVQQKKK